MKHIQKLDLNEVKIPGTDEHVKIEVFTTSTHKIRAKISEPNKPPYEVTINGQEWGKGKGSPYQPAILTKAENMLDDLTAELKKAKTS